MPSDLDLTRLAHETEATFYQASGPGGQHRNRTYSAVRLRHLPTGLVVTSADTRSQHRNRRIALERLARRLDELAHEPPPRLPTAKSPGTRRRERNAKARTSANKRARCWRPDE